MQKQNAMQKMQNGKKCKNKLLRIIRFKEPA